MYMRVVILLVLIVATLFGWRIAKAYKLKLTDKEEALAGRLKATVHYLAHDIGNRNYQNISALNAAADFIVERFEEFDYEVSEQFYELQGQEFRNIIAEKRKQPEDEQSPQETIIIGAHYDTCFNPGADDNASGVAALLELARLVKEEPLDTPVKFVAFTNEEPPFFKTKMMGSQIYARDAKENGERIKLAVVFEMIGYYKDRPFSQRYPLFIGPFFPNRANFIAMVTNFDSRGAARPFYAAFRKSSDFPAAFAALPSFIPGIDWSDHKSFWEKGYPALMLTDTSFYRNPHYHKQSDLPETLDYERLAKLVSGLKEALVHFAGKKEESQKRQEEGVK